MKSITELNQIKNDTLKRISGNNGFRILVGMATCGIAAGAKQVFDTLAAEIKQRELSNVELTITGCIGSCRLEPLVEVFDPLGRRVTYANVNPQKAARIVAEHIVNGRICLDYTVGAELSTAHKN